MQVVHIPFKETGFFSKTMIDYLNQSATIKSFYENFSDLEGIENQLKEKEKSFTLQSRNLLHKVLKEQYINVNASEKTLHNIELLKQENTFTITTGHQLNLFTGPLYFLYKIISAINLCEQLQEKKPVYNFVPIYWMASEDHDFDEINFFNFKGKKVQWNSDQTGPVGRFSTKGLQEVFEAFANEIGTSRNAIYLKDLFKKAYVEHSNLADATRFIANQLFSDYGLVVIDADNKELKQLFTPYVEREFVENISYKNVIKTNEVLGNGYKIQVNPREINQFYITDTLRERIIEENGVFKVNNTDITWSKTELLKELEVSPERFSPNVIMRPLYQEVILPNLVYIGGGGELAYWMELKSYFNAVNIPFPVLLLRNSVQVISEKQFQKLTKLDLTIKDVFTKQQQLLKDKVLKNSEVSVNFEEKRIFLKQQFNELKEIAEQTDKSFIGAVNAQEKKQLKGLDNLEKRLLRAEKRKQHDFVTRITKIQDELLPNNSLEERQRNFSEYYLEYGNDFIKVLKDNLQPLQLEFTVMVM